jgi:tRNA-dihydrouridine synthase 3
LFGVQLCGGNQELMAKCVEMLSQEISVDFIDVNLGCPIDMVYQKGWGSGLIGRPPRLRSLLENIVQVSHGVPITAKMRTGVFEGKPVAHDLLPMFQECGIDMVTLHGRSRQQRYTRLADWNYIGECSQVAGRLGMPFFGNGDILSYEEYYGMLEQYPTMDGVMIGRGALIKPWIFTEIAERRHWDIRSSERLDILKKFCNYGLTHWGSDCEGVNKTRRFLLEWLSFLYRYIPVGLLEVLPQRINERPPRYRGRDDLETLMASGNVQDWIQISEMLLGKTPDGFNFLPKHKSNAYESG